MMIFYSLGNKIEGRKMLKKDLDEKYKVYGSFYNICNKGKDIAKCRNNLEIFCINKKLGVKIKQFKATPDAVIVMMNPGSSRPLTNSDEGETKSIEISELSNKIIKNKMAVTIPDDTQYQIMRIMYNQYWGHVRVLNLSDIRKGDSGAFFKEVKKFEEHYKSQVHSIFSEERDMERNAAFSIRKNNPILLAWGCKNLRFQKELAERAIKKLNLIKHHRIIGLEHKKIPNLYYHPLPRSQNRQVEWIEDMIKKIEK